MNQRLADYYAGACSTQSPYGDGPNPLEETLAWAAVTLPKLSRDEVNGLVPRYSWESPDHPRHDPVTHGDMLAARRQRAWDYYLAAWYARPGKPADWCPECGWEGEGADGERGDNYSCPRCGSYA